MELPKGFDPLLHPPARLQIASVLARVSEAEFSRLRTITGASDSVLSKHLSTLNEAGHVNIRKANLDGRQRTWASLTRSGRAALDAHVAALHSIIGTDSEVPKPRPPRA
jgi:DNA-binding transcriptional ArsR family regulator